MLRNVCHCWSIVLSSKRTQIPLKIQKLLFQLKIDIATNYVDEIGHIFFPQQEQRIVGVENLA